MRESLKFKITVGAVGIAGFLGGFTATHALIAPADRAPAPAPVVIIDPNIPPCATEDDTWCVWDGRTRGNGQGPIVINGPAR